MAVEKRQVGLAGSIEREKSLQNLRLQATDLASNFYPGPKWGRIREALGELTGDQDNPWYALKTMSREEFAKRAESNGFSNSIPELHRDYEEYMSGKDTWFDKTDDFTPEQKRYLRKHPIASFSLEIALNKDPQTYSGGLGVLNGDVARQQSDMGLPVDNISLYYKKGYFSQKIDGNGNQYEEYPDQDSQKYPLEEVTTPAGEKLRIEIPMGDHRIYAKALKAKIGRSPLYLLDTDIPENKLEEDRWITGHLYGGSSDTRIRQEIVLGIGGVRLLEALGEEPSVLHLQEGHAAFAPLEAIAKEIEKGSPRETAIWKVQDETAVTNHTIVVNDFFARKEVANYLNPTGNRIGVHVDEIYDLGADEEERFSMTELALQTASEINGVSTLHTEVLRKSYPKHEFKAITNGVHIETWSSNPMQDILDQYLGKKWREELGSQEIFRGIYEIPDMEILEVQHEQEKRFIAYINEKYNLNLDPNTLTIGSARRFAPYKRGGLLLSDMDEAAAVIGDDEMPVQVIYAGKAHPHDAMGKSIIKDINQKIKDPRLKKRIAFIGEYDMSLARKMLAGVDVWMNTPRRGEEASGTSGMKASLNGVLQLTVSDGWADEVDWSDKGWTIGRKEDNFTTMTDDQKREADIHDGKELRRIVGQKIAPMYYGNKDEWVRRMKNTMVEVATNYSTRRMVQDHAKHTYVPILKRQLQRV